MPRIIYVNDNATGSNNGTSWANAYTDLQAAIAAAAPTDEIWVAAGTYKPATDNDRAKSFNLKNTVAIYGGFAGTETARSERNWESNVTILSGDIGAVGNNSDNSYSVVNATNVSLLSILDGFTITAGFNDSSAYGGGIYVSNTSATLSNLKIVGNSAYYGGGMYSSGSLSRLTNVTFTGNSAAYWGGGLYNSSSNLFLNDVTFLGNAAGSSGSGGGGGIYNESSSPSLNNVRFISNTSNTVGGGIYNSSSSPTLKNVLFFANGALSNGGGIYNSGSNPNIINAVFDRNSSNDNGGGIYNAGGSPVLTNVTFSGNVAERGGAIGSDNSTETITNSIFWGNQASISDNQISNISGNSTTTVTYSLVQGGYTGTGNINADPLFVDADNGDLRLQAGSPALNVGSNSANSEVKDLAGNPRIADTTIDLGAYEGVQLPPVPQLPANLVPNRIIYVNDDATGSNNGTSWANAYTDLQAAIAAAAVTDEIWVAAGTYKPATDNDRAKSFNLKNTVAIYGGFAGTETARSERNWESNVTILSGDIGAVGNNSDNSYSVVNATNVSLLSILDGFTITAGFNDSSAYGGGIYVSNTSATLSNLKIVGNSAYYGGGMYSSGSLSRLTNVTFTGNSAAYWGGGLYNSSSNLFLNDVTFLGNAAGSSGSGGGGGIYNESSSPSLNNVRFISNTSNTVGGGIYNSSSSPTLKNVLFFANGALSNGGGIYNSGSNPNIINAVFDRNSSNDNGGGIYNAGGSPVLTNVTFSGNVAERGGAIGSDNSTETITNSIFWGNQASISDNQISNISGNSTTTVTYSLVQGGYTGTGNINADPLFVDADNGDLRLQAGSPALNVGSNSANSEARDLAGNPRIADTTIDLGAYEGVSTSQPTITLAVSPASVTEDGTPNLVYTFTRTGVTTNALTVNYTIGGTATLNTDYTRTGTNNTVTFAAGSATATVTVNPTADTTVEPNETVVLTLATGTGYTIGTTTAVTGTITNDDVALPTITLAVSPASVTEDGTPNLVYTFTRTGVITNALTVNYTIAGTATNADYTGATPGTGKTITFAAGSATATVIVNPTADTTVEPNETVVLTLATGTGYTIGTTTAVTGTITNDDVALPTITLAVSPASVTEDGTPNLVYTFTRTGVITNALTVNYTIAGTATNADYTGATPGTGKTITFAANSATATVTVNPTADTTVEPNETVVLTLATGTGYTIGTTTAVTGTIIDDEPGRITGIKWNDLNGNGIREDLIQGNPPDIVFIIDISGSTSSAFQGLAVGDVNNDGTANTRLDAELAGFIALNNRLVQKGLGNTARIAIVTFQSTATQLDMNPNLTGIQLATNAATDSNNNGTRDIEEILRSLRDGGGTNFESALQRGQNTLTSLGTTAGNGNIIFISDGEVNEGGTYSDEVQTLRNAGVKLSAFGVGQDASLANLQVIDPNASIFTSTDQLLAVFDGLGGGTQGFQEPGLAGVTLYLDLNNNAVLDSGEPTQVTAADNPSTPNIDETGQYSFNNLAPGTYILREVVPAGFSQTFPNNPGFHTVVVGSGQTVNNINFGNTTPPSITLAVSPASVNEDGTPNLVYTFTRTGNLTNPLTVNYTIGGTATNGTDYATIPTSVTFGAGLSTATITVNPTADTTVESDETVALTLASGTGYTIGTTTAVTGTILNDDVTPTTVTLAVSPASVTEDGTPNLVYTFTRTGSTTSALTVNYTVAGTATNGTDYATIRTSVTFAAGSATATVTVNPTADTTVESDETVALTLATGTGYSIGTTTAVTGTITNDDVALPSVTLAVSPASVNEDGTPNLVYTFTRTGVTTNALTVNYTVGGTATNGTDYATIPTSVTFAAGSATATVTVNPTADTTVEANETVALTLATGTGYTIGTTTAVTGTILNDDTSVVISINDITVIEGKDSQAFLTVSLSAPSSQPVSVNYTTTPINSTANSDYTATTGTLTIPANSSTGMIAIPILNDNLNEPDEAFTVTLSNPVNATLGTDAVGEVIITDTWRSTITRTLPAGVENLQLIGNSAIDGTGNAGNNVLTGNSANNTLAGLDGNDTYAFLVNTPLGLDTINETTTGGIDTLNFNGTIAPIRLNLGISTNQRVVTSNLTLKLSANNVIENAIGGSGNDRITGNSLNNNLTGDSGNDIISAGAGNDILTGNAGDDILSGGEGVDQFNYLTGRAFIASDIGVDSLTDFTTASDKIALSKTTFNTLTSVVGNGFSQASNFAVVDDDSLVETSTAFIVYSSNSGSLFYNQNGSAGGLGTGAEFALLLNNPILTANDFVLVA
jgi:Ca2+-binding RTX toxin-like protein